MHHFQKEHTYKQEGLPNRGRERGAEKLKTGDKGKGVVGPGHVLKISPKAICWKFRKFHFSQAWTWRDLMKGDAVFDSWTNYFLSHGDE